MIAIEDRKYEGGNIWINPYNRKVGPNSIGLFITKSSDDAKRAWFYCRQGAAFLVANSNSSLYIGWSLSQSRHTSKVERYRGSERFSKNERFLLMMWDQSND